jgi:hypothetical protein
LPASGRENRDEVQSAVSIKAAGAITAACVAAFGAAYGVGSMRGGDDQPAGTDPPPAQAARAPAVQQLSFGGVALPALQARDHSARRTAVVAARRPRASASKSAQRAVSNGGTQAVSNGGTQAVRNVSPQRVTAPAPQPSPQPVTTTPTPQRTPQPVATKPAPKQQPASGGDPVTFFDGG